MSSDFLLMVSAFAAGFVVVLLLRALIYFRERRKAQTLAAEILAEAQENAASLEREAKSRAEDFEEQAKAQFEADVASKIERNEEMAKKVAEIEERWKEILQAREETLKKKKETVDQYEQYLGHKERKYLKIREQSEEVFNSFIEKLVAKSGAVKADVVNELATKFEQEAQQRASKQIQLTEAEVNADSEKLAKKIINISLNRFARPYCPERGIGYVHFSNEKVRDRVLGPNNSHLSYLEKICGVDLIYNQEMQSISVSGFDPVRRELARATLEKLCNEREINEQRIEQLVHKTKKDLFKKIRTDGQKAAAELGLKNLHPEILNMMGALRYRYSFAQNQYFHCSEVGFLCGLLASELNLPLKDGRRAGFLHDIGKAMDHSVEGGHAVIGADFIQKHGESPEIVHAVRAHHHDEQPSTDLAYLVIAADALSGARPGARRSTADSYMQKMNQLEVIGNSFEGVLSTYILSAGREVRLIVDSQKIDDHSALALSKKVARKIEEECSYPGLIKVTVVRETQAVEIAK